VILLAKANRTTISISEDLKRRMAAVKDRVNWSKVACEAFERKLAEIIARKGTKDMRDVIARLRASKAKGEGQDFEEGHKDGRRWAMARAEAAELKNLQRFHDDLAARPYDRSAFFDPRERSSAYSVAELLVFHMNPAVNGDRHTARSFWETLAGDAYETLSGGYYEGFVAGALKVWAEVEDQI
jgi:hypothetical protein